ncbi:RRQRL motif-containing zinc-binding protein [Spirillospora sp. NPDC050679]
MSRRSSARFWDPAGERHGIPTYPWGLAPEHLVTRRQLAEAGLRPGGQDPVAQVRWHSGHRTRRAGVAYLYDARRALPKRPMTPGRQAALERAMAARRTCPVCCTVADYCIPTSVGACNDCADQPTDPRSGPSIEPIADPSVEHAVAC